MELVREAMVKVSAELRCLYPCISARWYVGLFELVRDYLCVY